MIADPMFYEVLRSDGRSIPRLRCEVIQQAGVFELSSVARIRVRRLSAEREIKSPDDAGIARHLDGQVRDRPFFTVRCSGYGCSGVCN